MHFYLILFFSTIMVGCSSGINDSSVLHSETRALHGSWFHSCTGDTREQRCYHAEFDADAGRFIRRAEVEFGFQFRYRPAYDFYSTGSYTVTYDETGLWPLDWQIDSYFVVPRSRRFADRFNRLEKCGYSDWAEGEAKDVTNIACLYQGHVPDPQVVPFLVRLDGRYLYFGEYIDDQTRPTSLQVHPHIRN